MSQTAMPGTHALYPVADLRGIEQTALASHPPGTLMQRAADAAARCTIRLLNARGAAARVLAIAGPGNNGGDALLAALSLRQAGINAVAMLCPEQASRPQDAQRALALAQAGGVPLIASTAASIRDGGWDLVLDGLFGIGLARPLDGQAKELVQAMNALACPLLALDIPSGLNADTGMPVGADGIAVRATHTITFIADKPGLHTGQGRDHAGEVLVDRLGIGPDAFPPGSLMLNGLACFADAIRPRPHYSHKGSYGDVRLAGGAHGMAGALVLAARAALMSGAGRVFAGFLDEPPAYDALHPELMCRRAADMDFGAGAGVIGPGLGNSDAARKLLRQALDSAIPLVLDADALNLLASDTTLRDARKLRGAPLLLTPHPLEAARLLGCQVMQIQSDRVAMARSLARDFQAVVILKGSGSVIADADGNAAINPTGNPALATGGTGDVLAGVCGALLAQRYSAWHAALAAAWVHGRAADKLVAHGCGPVGLTAGELIPAIRATLNALVAKPRPDALPQS